MNASISELLEEHFDTAFAAPDGIKKLRDLILSLALQGKLVEQNPNDPPASELLKEIESERKKLVKAGKIKKAKPLPKVQESDILYDLPDSWTWTRLGNIGNIFNGNSINAREKQSKYAGVSGLPYIATKDVGYGFEPLDYKNGINIPESEPKFKVAHKGAVLICSEGGSAGKKCGITEEDICFGNKLYANESFGGITSRFILYLYLSPVFRDSFSAAMTGIIGGVSMAKFLALPIPLPPLKEQHRIVTKIDKLMARCDELERLRKEREEKRLAVHAAAIKQLLDAPDGSAWDFIQKNFGELYTVKENIYKLRKAILQLAVMGRLAEQNPNDPPASELLKQITAEKQRLIKEKKIKKAKTLPPFKQGEVPYQLPKGWAWTRLGELLVFGPKNGYSPASVNYETPVCSLTLSATTSGTFKGEYSKYIDEQIESDSHLWLKRGDILVQRGNTIEYVGVSAVYHGEDNTYIYPDLMMKLRVASSLSVEYAHIMMSADYSRNFMRAHASGTSGTMPKINQAVVNNVPFALPPLSEQFRIVAKVEHLLTLCDSLEQQIDATTDKQTELLNAVMAQV
ncbi:type I restriction modification DNA specificity domain protein [Candidatus Magnetomorum sp. HK-1]|nr:type I restriction modification DNA specificity domain protein [Candidatus Magnetomorum sp. HK-1]